MTVDGQGNAYVTGSANSRDFLMTAGAYQTEFKGTGGERQIIAGDVRDEAERGGQRVCLFDLLGRRTGCSGRIWSSQRRTCPDGRCVCDAVGCRAVARMGGRVGG